jgi:hypothetical protein
MEPWPITFSPPFRDTTHLAPDPPGQARRQRGCIHPWCVRIIHP